MNRLPILLLTSLLAAACGTVASATRPVAEPVGNLLLSAEEEEKLGDQLAAEVQSYVDRIGPRLAQASGRELPFRTTFTVLDKPDEVNAFALPGGHIFVYSGLIRAADSEAQLASVLGHELAHVTAGHVRDQLAAQVGTQTLSQLALGQQPGVIEQLASQIVSAGYLAAYSRDAEREADSRGLNYLAAAGYEPSAMVGFFQELARMAGDSPGVVSQLLASHPQAGDRADRVRQLIQERGLGGGRGAVVGGFESIQAQVGGAVMSLAPSR